MNDGGFNGQSTSLEEHLTNSIRRAKERIYKDVVSNYSNGSDFSLSQIQDSMGSKQMRGRTNSQHINASGGNYKEEKSVLAMAMRTLQERIMQLERENEQLQQRSKQAESLMQTGKRKQQKEQFQLSSIIATLRERQHEIKRLARNNSDLNEKNQDLTQRIEELQEEIRRLINNKLNNPAFHEDYHSREEVNRTIILEKELKINELQEKIVSLQKKNAQSSEIIEQFAKKLQEQKKINMRWIKLHEGQLNEQNQKQNNSLEVNIERNPAIKHSNNSKRLQYVDLLKKNKEMYEKIQRNNAKVAQLTRQCKQHEEKFNQMKLIALQIAENVNKILPHQPSHIKYLTMKILKLENSHVESLRSFSNIRRSRVFQRNSNSKERKRSLKMSDLNSSAKKSQEKSHSKSHKKKQAAEQFLTRSQKKPALIKQEDELQEMEKEVLMLMKKYRNFIAKAQKDKNNEELAKKIEQTANEYNDKKRKLDQLKKNLAAPMKPKKDAPIHN